MQNTHKTHKTVALSSGCEGENPDNGVRVKKIESVSVKCADVETRMTSIALLWPCLGTRTSAKNLPSRSAVRCFCSFQRANTLTSGTTVYIVPYSICEGLKHGLSPQHS